MNRRQNDSTAESARPKLGEIIMPYLFENSYALLIGINENRVPAWTPPVVAQNVGALETILVHLESCAYPVENVRKIWGLAAPRASMFEGLVWMRDCIQKDASGNATMVIFYIGHGWCPEPPAVRNEWGKKQDPGYQISGSNFSIAMLLGGKGLSRGQTAPSPLETPAQESACPVYWGVLRGTGSQ
jgi:hypothetical protein